MTITATAESVEATPAATTETTSPGPEATAPPATPDPDSKAQETPAKPEDAAPKPEDAKLTPRFVELSRREKKLVERDRQLKETEARIREQEASVKAWETARAKVKEDPLAALEALGVDMDTLVQSVIRSAVPETVEQKVERLERERQAEKQAAKDAEELAAREAEEAALNQFRATVKGEVSAMADCELVNAQEAHDLVFEVIVTEFEKSKTIIPTAQAAQMVEDFLFEKAKTVATKSKKLAALFAPPPPAPAPAKPASKLSPTLTQSLGAVVPPKETPHYESHEEAVARIAAKLRASKATKSA